MAKNDKKINNRAIRKFSGAIQDTMDGLYQSTYYSSPQLGRDLMGLTKDVNTYLDRITNQNMDAVGVPNISKVYSRLNLDKQTSQSGTNSSFINSIEDLFSDRGLMDDFHTAFMENKYLFDLDMEIDNVCRYMPKLEEALDAKKDNVLSADHFSKDFITVTGQAIGEEETFSKRVSDIKTKYELLEKVEEIYYKAAKYGEQFVYTVPYKKAMQRLLQNKPQLNNGMGIRQESAYTTEGSILAVLTINNEGSTLRSTSFDTIQREATYSFTEVKNGVETTSNKKLLENDEQFSIKFEMNTSGIIDSLVSNMINAQNTMHALQEKALCSFGEAGQGKKNTVSPDASGNLSFDGMPSPKDKIKDYSNSFDSTAAEGLSSNGYGNDKDANIKIKAPGCVFKQLKRERVIPSYIDDMCMGYYYIEFIGDNNSEDLMGFKNIMSNPMSNARNYTNSLNNVNISRQDELTRYISGQLSTLINKSFINNNQDLAKELYTILKHNDIYNGASMDRIRVTFIAPQDMIHVYFRLDPDTHRGISDLDRALVPAKIYSSLYVTNSIQILTRGSDKRAYYVKQAVDTNTAGQLLNTISQIKQGNFGLRQFSSINNVMNITGRFNDYIIPVNSSNDPPISFEVIPGMNVDVKTDFMGMLEEMAINSTDVPLELIQSRQSVDYATQLTMSNSKFLRKVYSRQGKFQKFLSRIFTTIYNSEYDECQDLEVKLPPPTFLNIVNTNQLITNTKEYIQSIHEIDTQYDNDETFKQIYMRDLFEHYIGTYIDMNYNKVIYDRAKIKAGMIKSKEASNDGDTDAGGVTY